MTVLRPVITIAFWALVALDVLGVLLLFFLGLAAAGSARTNPLLVTLLLLVLPCIPLLASVVVFIRASNPAWRLFALALAAAPLLIAISARAVAEVQLRANTNEQGLLTFFRPGPMRAIAEAIGRNDTAAFHSLISTVDVNRTGLSDMTLLMLAMRQLRRTPEQQEVLGALLEAGADPNRGAQSELPLSIAIQLVRTAGPGPVKALLDAGANPNLTNDFGVPVWFAATGQSASAETLALLLDHQVDVNFVDRNGQTALFAAAAARNWKAALLLLERGSDWRAGRSVNGLPFKSLIDSYAGSEGTDSAFVDVRRYLERQ
jgi:Ankyrin repeats (3 copies)